MPAVNPEILAWARESAGLTLQDAVSKVGIRDARGVTAVDRLAALERGDDEPSRSTLVNMAKQYRRPLLAFYLTAPPRQSDLGADFRSLPVERSLQTDALVEALVRNVRSRQYVVRAALEAEDEAETVPWVGWISKSTRGSQWLRDELQSQSGRVSLERRCVQGLERVLGPRLDVEAFYAEASADQAFALLRAGLEEAGVFVLLKGDLGTHHSAMDVEVFRGFAIADEIAPFVVINDNDSRAAWSFTLLHEVTHLLLGQTGLSGAHAGTAIEQLCNNVASEWLLPSHVLAELAIDPTSDSSALEHRIDNFVRTKNISRTMVAYRLLKLGSIDGQMFDRLRSAFRDQWRQHRDRQRTKARESKGGPNYFTVRRHRVGNALLSFARRMNASGALSTTKTARLLGVRPAHVGKMVTPQLR